MNRFLSASFFALCACLFFHTLKAEASVIFYEDDGGIAGKEYIFDNDAPIDSSLTAPFVLNENYTDGAIINDSLYIYIDENAIIYGKDHLITEQNTAKNIQKPKVKTKPKADSFATNITTKNEEEHKTIILSAFPLSSSSPSSFLYASKESTNAVSKQKNKGKQSKNKICWDDVYQHAEHQDLLIYFPEQRQKLSAIATQCGILSSFSPNSPTC